MKGFGKLFDSETGDVYLGNFMSGKRHGIGKYYNAEKDEIYDGNWNYDKKNGSAKIISRNG